MEKNYMFNKKRFRNSIKKYNSIQTNHNIYKSFDNNNIEGNKNVPKRDFNSYEINHNVKFVKNNDNNCERNLNSISQPQSKVLVIPGYYYDEESKRYFPEKNFHNKEFSNYIKEKNERIIKENSSNIKINEIKKIEQTLSTFIQLKNNKLGIYKTEIKRKFNENTENNEMNQLNLIKLKTKSLDSKYDVFIGNKRTYLITLDNNTINIQNIMISENNSSIFFKIYFDYTKSFTNFKIINEFLFLFSKFQMFTVNIKAIIDNYENGIFTFHIDFYYQNLTSYLNKIYPIPGTYMWPVIKEYKSKTSFLFLFYKKIFSVNFNLENEVNQTLNKNIKEVNLNHCTINLTELIKENKYNLIQIETEKSFENCFFTELCYNPQTKIFYFGESMGNIHIYDHNFKLMEIIKNSKDKSHSIIDLVAVGREIISIASNSNMDLIHNTGKKFNITTLYHSSLQSFFKVKKHSFLINQKYLLFMNEMDEYAIYNLRKMRIEKILKLDDNDDRENKIKNFLFVLINHHNENIYKLID